MNNEPNSPSNEGSAQGSGNQAQGGANQDKTAQYTAKTHETAEQLKAAAVGQAEEIRKKADTVKDQALNRIRRVGSMLQSASSDLRSEDEFVAGYAERAAHQIDEVVNYLASTDPKVLARDAERMARENPAWFFGGAFVVGLAAARFLKSSSQQQSSSDGSDSGQPQRAGNYRVGAMAGSSGARPQPPPAPQRPRTGAVGQDHQRTSPGLGTQPARRPNEHVGDVSNRSHGESQSRGHVADNPNRGAGR